MDIGGFLIAIAVGMVVGGLAEQVVPHGGYGRMADVLLGVAGSGAASVATWVTGAMLDGGLVVTIVVAVVGAGAFIIGQRKIVPAPLVAPRKVGGSAGR